MTTWKEFRSGDMCAINYDEIGEKILESNTSEDFWEWLEDQHFSEFEKGVAVGLVTAWIEIFIKNKKNYDSLRRNRYMNTKINDVVIKIFFISTLVLTVISFLNTGAYAESIKETDILTDSSWKVFDEEMKGWTSIDFDDSYWPDAKEKGVIGSEIKTQIIGYPEKLSSPPYYYRKIFELEDVDIVGAELFNYYNVPKIKLNDNIIGFEGRSADIKPYLKAGKILLWQSQIMK